MKKESKIHNIQELRDEIARLKELSNQQEMYLKDQYQLLKNKVEAPARIFNNLISFIPGASVVKNLLSSIKGASGSGKSQNIFSKILRIGATAAIDRLFLRKAGVLKRILLGLLSQQAIGMIDKNVTNGLIDKISEWFQSLNRKAKTETHFESNIVNFGIPPDSETY